MIMYSPLPHPYVFGDYGHIGLSGLGDVFDPDSLVPDTQAYDDYWSGVTALPGGSGAGLDTSGFDWGGLIGDMTQTAAATYLKTLQLQPGVYQVKTKDGYVSYVQPNPNSPLPGQGTAGFIVNKAGAAGGVTGIDTNTMMMVGIIGLVVLMMSRGK